MIENGRMNALRFRTLVLLLLLVTACTGYIYSQAPENCTGAAIFNAKNCVGDTVSAEERNLFDIINRYRTENGRSALQLSTSLSMVANRRMLDLNQNMKTITHSWSNCPYDIKDEKTWPCQIDSPRRLNSGYSGDGYETLYRTTASVEINAALAAWKKSALHSSIILNQGMFDSMPWEEFGVAISGSYASLWFGYSGSAERTARSENRSSGSLYDSTVAGVFKSLAIEQRSATIEPNGLRGFSADKKLKVEFSGAKRDLAETTITITSAVTLDGNMDSVKKAGISKVLVGIFPEWSDVDTWVDNTLKLIAQNRTVWKTRIIRGLMIEMKVSGSDAVMLSIKPQMKKVPIEM